MICKDEDTCDDCYRRRKKKDCGYEPIGYGPDIDGEYSVLCIGKIGASEINSDCFDDCLREYCGVGDPIPWDLMYPLMIWHGFNWLNDNYCLETLLGEYK